MSQGKTKMDASTDFFDRRIRFINKAIPVPGSLARVRHQYAAIVSQNRGLFRGARILDLMSGFGFWSMAALDEGAAHVVGLETAQKAVEGAKQAFAAEGIDPSYYQFVNSAIPKALRALKPGTFDLVLSHGFLIQTDPRFFFQQMSRLQVKHVILDTRIARGQGRIVRFALRDDSAPGAKYNKVLTIPNHELIEFLCDYCKFRWRLIDWQAMGIADWSGIGDYESDSHRTYVLERAPGKAPATADDLE